MQKTADLIYTSISQWITFHQANIKSLQIGIEVTKDQAYKRLVAHDSILIFDCKNDLSAQDLYFKVNRRFYGTDVITDSSLSQISIALPGKHFFIGIKN